MRARRIPLALALAWSLAAAAPAAQPEIHSAKVLAAVCYHRFGAETAKDPYCISLERLGAQLDWLKADGWQSVSLAQVAAALRGDTAGLPDKGVLLSVDDGYQAGEGAAAVLEARGFHGVFFVYPEVLGHGKFMAPADLKKLEARGHEVASHTFTHPNLAKVPAGMDPKAYRGWLRHELLDAKTRIESLLGHPVEALAWPYGAYNPAVAQAAWDAGYRQLWSVSGGVNAAASLDARRLRRVLLMGHPPLAAFQRALTHGQVQVDVDGLVEGDLLYKSQLPHRVVLHGRDLVASLGQDLVREPAGGDSLEIVIPAGSVSGFHYLTVEQQVGSATRRLPLLFQVAPDAWRPHFQALLGSSVVPTLP